MMDEFTSNKETYRLVIKLDDGLGYSHDLDTENISMFSYSNEMNRLYTVGYIEYVDRNAIVDKFVESQYSTCTVNFEKITRNQEGSAEKLQTMESVTLNFIIKNMEILENRPGQITYKIHIISSNYPDLFNNVKYTTYGSSSLTPTEIIGDLFTLYTGMKINAPSFENNSTGTGINYITEENDDMFSSIKYLMNRTCFTDKCKDSSIKTLIYDEKSNVVFLFDTGGNCGSTLGSVKRAVEIRVFKGVNEIDNEIPVYIGYVSRKSKIDAIIDTKSVKFVTYDIGSNTFTTSTLEEIQQKHIFSGNSGSIGKMNKMAGSQIYSFQREWNNDIDNYNKIFDAITKTNGLIVNNYGEIGILPGFSCQVQIPSVFPTDSTMDASKQQITSEQIKYQQFTGSWNIFKVEHFISPIKKIFRQKLVLYRNWI